MKRIAGKQKPSLTLLWLSCVLALSGCATAGQAAKPSACPMLPPPPANVMRPPSAEKSLRALLFESAETPTTSSERAKP